MIYVDLGDTGMNVSSIGLVTGLDVGWNRRGASDFYD